MPALACSVFTTQASKKNVHWPPRWSPRAAGQQAIPHQRQYQKLLWTWAAHQATAVARQHSGQAVGTVGRLGAACLRCEAELCKCVLHAGGKQSACDLFAGRRCIAAVRQHASDAGRQRRGSPSTHAASDVQWSSQERCGRAISIHRRGQVGPRDLRLPCMQLLQACVETESPPDHAF